MGIDDETNGIPFEIRVFQSPPLNIRTSPPSLYMAWNMAGMLMAAMVALGGAAGVVVIDEDGAMLDGAHDLVSGVMMDEGHSGMMGDHSEMTDDEKAAMREQMQRQHGDHSGMMGDHSEMMGDHTGNMDNHQMDGNHSSHIQRCLAATESGEMSEEMAQRCRRMVAAHIDEDGDGIDKVDIAKACKRVAEADNAPDQMVKRCRIWATNQVDEDDDGVDSADIAAACREIMTSEQSPDVLKNRCKAWVIDKIDRDGDGIDKVDIAKVCKRVLTAENAPDDVEQRCKAWFRNQIDVDGDGIDRADILRAWHRLHGNDGGALGDDTNRDEL